MKLKILGILFIIFTGCSPTKTITVGFIGPLSGPYSELGIQARNGLILAIEEAKLDSKLKNVQINIIYKDNQGDPQIAMEAARELVRENVDLILGPYLSSMAIPVIQGTMGSDTLILSPTVGLDDIKGIDDNFIRITPVSSKQGIILGEIIKYRNKNTAFILDINNKSYGESIIDGFQNTIGNNYPINIITLKSITDLEYVISRIDETDPESLVFITNGQIAAQIIQNINLGKKPRNLYGVSWSKVTNIHLYGGKLLEGMIFIDDLALMEAGGKEDVFNSNYRNRFQISPTLPALNTYEAMNLFLGVKKNNLKLRGNDLKMSIINLDSIDGVREIYKMDEYGEVNKSFSPYIFRNGRYEPYEK